MRKIDLFAKNELSEPETDELLRGMLQKTLGEQQKEQWALQLESQYGIVRKPANTKLQAHTFAPAWRWAAAVALIVTASAGLWYFLFPQDKYQQLADRVLESEKIGYADLRKGETISVTTRLQAVEAYQRGDYATAIEKWRSMQQTPLFDEDDQFYLAMSYLYDGSYETAYLALEQHTRLVKQGGRFEEEAAFFKAVALLKMGRTDEAEQILAALQVTAKSSVMQQKATSLLNALK